MLAQLRGESLLALGRVDDAGRAFERAADDAEAFSKPVVQWQALAGLADAHQRAGREGQARDTARAAVRLVDRLAAGLAPERRRDFRGRARARIPGVALRADKGEQYAGLTPRQREVAALLARGLTNREIAETLVISPLTAETHVKHILARLGFASRAQVAAWVVDKGLAAGEDD